MINKQLTTVYVPNKETHQEFLMYLKSKGELEETQAYLYTEQEHQAAQGYRDALEKIAELCDNQNPTHADIWYIAHEHLCAIPAQQALSAAPTTQQTNVLDELEKWARKGSIKCTIGIMANDKYTLGCNAALTDLLNKIQSLKPQQ